jgi:sulfonate transport system substrate-binding protein
MLNRLLLCAGLIAVLAHPVPTASAASTPVRVGIDVGVNSLPFWIGMKNGYFEKNGLDLKVKTYDSGFLGLLAIGAGEGDFSSQSDTPTLTLTSKGIDAVVIGIMAHSADNYKIVGKNEITNPKGLKGRRFGMTLGSACEYVGLKYLKTQGLTRADVKIVGAAPSELAPLLVKGDIDASCFWEPWGRKVLGLASTSLHVIGTGRDIYAANMYLTVRRKFAEEHPDAVKGMLRALEAADKYIAEHPQEAVEMIQSKHRVDQKMAQTLSKDFDYKLFFDRQAFGAMKEVGQWLLENKKLTKLPEWNRIIDTHYLNSVVPEAATIKP